MLLYATMLGKILLTLAVLVAAILIIRVRLRRSAARPAGLSGTAARSGKPIRVAAYTLLAVMFGGSLLYLILEWRTQREVVQVRVVNAYTGESVRYEARRGAVQARQFMTLNGRWIVLAEVERLELEDPD